MFGPFERMVAMRYLRARRREGFISVIAWFSLIGIALGVATLIIVMSVMNGFRAELFSRILGLNGHLIVSRPGQPFIDHALISQRIEGLAGVVAAAPMIEGQALMTFQRRPHGVVVRGLAGDDLRRRPILSTGIVAGSLQDFGSNVTDILVGHRLATKLGLKLGEVVTMISPQPAETVLGVVPRLKRFKVAAVFDVGMHEYDSNFVFIPLRTAQAFFQVGEAVGSVDVILEDSNQIDTFKDGLRNVLEDGYLVRDWRSINASFVNALKVERNVMFLILTLIILVAAFNIISSLIMMVKDKGRDIAIMRTMGASRGAVMRIFVLSGTSIGVIGTVAGVGLGLLLATNIQNVREALEAAAAWADMPIDLFSAEIYFLSQLPSQVFPSDVISVAIMSLALSFLATLYPSWRAARIDPVEALRYE
ncbi:MAG: lipoprotein-releasing ABC transporter permease subunit [Alphaproteobacteria bacterium]|nr:lipoprotein-releasing ABC transporter permease subunit [Alphaproteobacteria bacterium]